MILGDNMHIDHEGVMVFSRDIRVRIGAENTDDRIII